MSTRVVHLDFPKLKAFVGRLHTVIALDGPPEGERGTVIAKPQAALIKAMLDDADRLEAAQGRLDHTLLAFVERWKKEGGSHPDALQARLKALGTIASKLRCSDCALDDAYVCRGDPSHDDVIIAKGGACIEPLTDLLDAVESFSARVYAETRRRFTPPSLLLTTSSGPAPSENARGEHSVSGYHEVADAVMSRSKIGLEIREEAFNWHALCGMLYVLTHEVICHAFQGVIVPGTNAPPGRVGAPQECAWSEGWMDRVAFRLTHSWLSRRTQQLPRWLARDLVTAERVTNAIHDARYKRTDVLTSDVIHEREYGRRGFDLLFKAFASRCQIEKHPALSFSLLLNMYNLDFDARSQATFDLYRTLRRNEANEVETLVGLCRELQEFDDVPAFLREAHALAEGKNGHSSRA